MCKSQAVDLFPGDVGDHLFEVILLYLALSVPAYHANGVLQQSSSFMSLYLKVKGFARDWFVHYHL